jgi:hypothetical protein
MDFKEMKLKVRKQPFSGNWAIYDEKTDGIELYEESITQETACRIALCWNSYESNQQTIKDLVEALKAAMQMMNSLEETCIDFGDTISALCHRKPTKFPRADLTPLNKVIAAAEKGIEK